ncbi:hypothetical protein IG631_01416 [Alternaria alternata]|nr:hypothetical protein IG631_01416 [Alternaria alternata]
MRSWEVSDDLGPCAKPSSVVIQPRQFVHVALHFVPAKLVSRTVPQSSAQATAPAAPLKQFRHARSLQVSVLKNYSGKDSNAKHSRHFSAAFNAYCIGQF